MVLVVLGHAIQCVLPEECNYNHLWNIIYSFHMPAFMAVSGWFAYKSATRIGDSRNLSAIYRRFKQLIIPFVLWTILSMIISCNVTISALIKVIVYPDNSFWFLWVLFCINVLFLIGRKIASLINVEELIINSITCILLLVLMVMLEIRVFGFQFLAYYFIFYLFGYCMHRFPQLKAKSIWSMAFLTAIWAFLAWYWNMHELPSWLQGLPYVPSTLLQYAYRGLTALIAVYVILSSAEKLFNKPSKINTLICRIGVLSLGVYVCHLTIIGRLYDGILYFCDLGNAVNIIVLFIIGLISSILIVGFLAKFKATSKLLLGKF